MTSQQQPRTTAGLHAAVHTSVRMTPHGGNSKARWPSSATYRGQSGGP